MAHFLTTLTFILHILGGAIGMVAGLAALCVRKGGRVHRVAGDVFVVAMLVMAIFAAVLGVIMPGQIINVFIAAFTLYLVVTGWLAARREGIAGVPEKLSLAFSLSLCVPFALLIFQIVTGVKLFDSAFKVEGSILVALCVFSAITVTAAVGDLGVVFWHRGTHGVARITRHLWRMCFGLALSLGSAFTNGFSRLLPGPYHVPPVFFLPQLLMLVVLLFWVVRVRFPGWRP